jgi:hypothetical protein
MRVQGSNWEGKYIRKGIRVKGERDIQSNSDYFQIDIQYTTPIFSLSVFSLDIGVTTK